MGIKRQVSLCDKNGVICVGSDGRLTVDGRWSHARISAFLSAYRDRFRDNFPDKYAVWTHWKFGWDHTTDGIVRPICAGVD